MDRIIYLLRSLICFCKLVLDRCIGNPQFRSERICQNIPDEKKAGSIISDLYSYLYYAYHYFFSTPAKITFSRIGLAVFVYFFFDNIWWIMVFEGTLLIDIFPE
jgi:hypothetical protein